MALICDTGPLYAAMDRADRDHAACAKLLAESEESLIVPAPVVVELEWLASKRLPAEAFSEFLTDVEDGVILVVDLAREDYARVRNMRTEYAYLQLGLVDAAVIAIAEKLAEDKLATLDHRHFRVVRPCHVEALTLLPLHRSITRHSA